jgi:hypothetical protein
MGAVRAPSPVPAAVVANRAERGQAEPIKDDGSRDKTYRPGRTIGDLPRRQNPPRNRRPPVRYSDSVFEVNCIFIDMEKKTEGKSATDVSTSEIRQHHGKKPTAAIHVEVGPAAIFYVIMFMTISIFCGWRTNQQHYQLRCHFWASTSVRVHRPPRLIHRFA